MVCVMKKLILLIGALLLTYGTAAQSFTFNHDEVVMNQFTVAETGTGNLGGNNFQWYYDLFHNSYSDWAPEKNKQAFRLENYYTLHKEVPMAETIDTCLKERAKIEGFNLIDRQVDLVWSMEKSKIEAKQQAFQKNINSIVPLGGTSIDKKHWQNVYEAIDCGLRAVRDGYLPNSERQKSYLLMYKDLVRYNTQLVALLIDLSNRNQLKDIEKANSIPRSDVTRHATSCFARWKVALTTGGSSKISGGQGIGIQE